MAGLLSSRAVFLARAGGRRAGLFFGVAAFGRGSRGLSFCWDLVRGFGCILWWGRW